MLFLALRRSAKPLQQPRGRLSDIAAIKAAERFQRELKGIYLNGRQIARHAGLGRLGAELERARESFRPAFAGVDGIDLKRAQLAANGYAKAWLGNARKLQSLPGATKATEWKLRQGAATENSQAFNSGRAQALQLATVTRLMRVWDATLDKRTCPICSAADGTIVDYRQSFPLGEPGSVHINCRCSFTILRADEVGTSSLITPVRR